MTQVIRCELQYMCVHVHVCVECRVHVCICGCGVHVTYMCGKQFACVWGVNSVCFSVGV